MKFPKLPLRKKLRASTARRSSFTDAGELDEMSEPNMKLSRALLIVLVLHVVAVAGIVAFNTIKSRQGTLPPAADASAPAQAPPPARSTATPPVGPAANAAAAVANRAPLPAAVPAEPAIPRALPVTTPETARTYTVVKGDNPVRIARKLNVSKDELLKLNKITDPTKLQIGQKLQVPTRTLAKPAATKPAANKSATKSTPKPTTKSATKTTSKSAKRK